MKNLKDIVKSVFRRQAKQQYMYKKQDTYNETKSDSKEDIDYYCEEYMKSHKIYIYSSIKDILNRTNYY